jgi:hypothetical protein
MSTEPLAVLVLVPTAAVVVAVFAVMWRERRSPRDGAVAIVAGLVLLVWAVTDTVLAVRGAFIQPDAPTPPPVGINLLVVFAGMTLALASSRSLRRLLSNQKNLIRLNLWRLVGVVFLVLMAHGQMPALWALPAGIGDIIVGATAWWVASRVDEPGGRRLAIAFNLFGLADLIVAVGLGITTNVGPTRVFHTTPTSELVTRFPLALVPTFLVPLAFFVHIVSLWQLFHGSWASDDPLAQKTKRVLEGTSHHGALTQR